MGKRRKTGSEDEAVRRGSVLGFALPLLGMTLAGMTIFNAFFGQAGTAAKGDITASTTSRTPDTSKHVLILKYDETVEDVQRELLAAGMFVGLVDGVDGPQTRVAVETYQRANDLDITGMVSPSLLEHIRYTRKLAQASKYTGSIAPVAELQKAKAVIPVPTAKPRVADQTQQGAFAELQKRLAKLGYDPGTRSGQLDEATKSAILIFAMDNGLAMDGKVNKAFLTALKQAETKFSTTPE